MTHIVIVDDRVTNRNILVRLANSLEDDVQVRAFAEARGVLAEAAQLIDKLHGALARCGSPYAAVPAALLHLAGREPSAVSVESVEDEAGEVGEEDRARMDAEWAEAPVVFGPDGFDPATAAPSGCGRAADMVKRMAAPSGGRRA